MKKNIVITLISVVILFVALPIKWAVAIIIGCIIISAFFALLYAVAKKADEELADIEKSNPELAREIRLQMMEDELIRNQMMGIF